MEEFSTVVQTLYRVSGLRNCLEFSQLSPVFYTRLCKHGKSPLLLKWKRFIVKIKPRGEKVRAFCVIQFDELLKFTTANSVSNIFYHRRHLFELSATRKSNVPSSFSGCFICPRKEIGSLIKKKTRKSKANQTVEGIYIIFVQYFERQRLYNLWQPQYWTKISYLHTFLCLISLAFSDLYFPNLLLIRSFTRIRWFFIVTIGPRLLTYLKLYNHATILSLGRQLEESCYPI